MALVCFESHFGLRSHSCSRMRLCYRVILSRRLTVFEFGDAGLIIFTLSVLLVLSANGLTFSIPNRL